MGGGRLEGVGRPPCAGLLACSEDTTTEQGAGLERLPDRANNLDEHCDAQVVTDAHHSPICTGDAGEPDLCRALSFLRHLALLF